MIVYCQGLQKEKLIVFQTLRLEDHGNQKSALKIPKRPSLRQGTLQSHRVKRKRDEGKENQNQQKRVKYNSHSSNVLSGCPKYNSNYDPQQGHRRPRERGEKLKIVIIHCLY